MACVRVLTMKFPRVTKIGQSIASMRTTPQVSGLGPVTVYIARFKCRAGLDPDRAYLFQLGSAHQKVAPGRARSTRLHCHLFCRAVLDPGRALSICGSVNVAIVKIFVQNWVTQVASNIYLWVTLCLWFLLTISHSNQCSMTSVPWLVCWMGHLKKNPCC